ncbi:hypothetical protein F5Y17DRAFT_476000 [Xylariaceae sp. FL0594]|nr:hypothetical protein F5Y17DRAFT_476000 [Xylariaceae sp. FL0594]
MLSNTTPRGEATPVAIVGMGCRWPGGVRSPSDMWELLKNKRDGWREFDEPRFSSRGYYHPNQDRPGTVSTNGGFLVDEDPRLFDHTFFGMTAIEVETMDPSQRKLLEVVYEAFEGAGESLESISGSNTGVFIGNFSLDHWMMQARDWDFPRPYATTGAATSILANCISYIFNLKGPSLAIDTACSSSMYAIHLAVNAIRNGDCDSAIVAASNWLVDPSLQLALNKLGALSPTSRKSTLALSLGSPIRAFIRGTAINANGRTGGITRPNAAGQEAVIRKAYENAGNLSPSDTTYFECHGTGTPVGDPIEVLTVGSVFSSFRSTSPGDRLLLGSVKTNLGHTEGASAIAAVMKVVLALEAEQIPPSFGVEKLNPNIDFDAAHAEVVTELMPWPAGRPRRAGINSFGFGGADGHCIIDHVNDVLPTYVKPGTVNQTLDGYRPSGGPLANGSDKTHLNGKQTSNGVARTKGTRKIQKTDATTRSKVLLPFSAHNKLSLELNIRALSEVVSQWPLSDIAYTLGCKRSKLSQRTYRIVEKDKPVEGLVLQQPIYATPVQPARVGFVFTGQGAQWSAMGAALFEYRTFRSSIDSLDGVLRSAVSPPPPWTLRDILAGHCEEDLIQIPEITQVACTALQVGLVDLLSSWSVQPVGIVGHSSGEMAATYAAGRITAAEAILAAYFRGKAVSKNDRKGAMLAVGLGVEEASQYVVNRQDVTVAAINSSGSVTLSGGATSILALAETLSAKNVFNRVLQTGGNAYHSHHMIALGQQYEDGLSGGLAALANETSNRERSGDCRWVSSVFPFKDTADLEITASYWRANLESPVRFSDAVASLLGSENIPIDVLVEVGPHPALKGPVDQTLKLAGVSIPYIPTLKRNADGQVGMLELAGALFGLNAEIDIVSANAVDGSDSSDTLEHGCLAVGLPPYQYAYGPPIYHESRMSKEIRLRKEIRHDLLGSKIPGSSRLYPQWRNILRMNDVPWLADHRLITDAVFPAAGYMVMAIEAATIVGRETCGESGIKGYSLRNVHIKTTLRIPEDDRGVEIIFSLQIPETPPSTAPGWATFSISSVGRDDKQMWTEHCIGSVRTEVRHPGGIEKMGIDSTQWRPVDSRSWYHKFAEIGLGYGPSFRPLSKIQGSPEESLASADVALHPTFGMMKGGESEYALHPASLDATFQLGLIACHGGQVSRARTAFVPMNLSYLYLDKELGREDSCVVVAQGELRGLRGAYIRLQMMNKSGQVVLHLESLRCISYTDSAPSEKAPVKAFSSPFARMAWKPDIRTLDNTQCRRLFPPPDENVNRIHLLHGLNRLASMVVVETAEKSSERQDSLAPAGNVGNFFSWIKRHASDDGTEFMQEARSLSGLQRAEVIEEIYSELRAVPEARAVKALHSNMDDILHERRTGADVLVGEEILSSLYGEGLFMTSAYPQLSSLFDSLSHANPSSRILELGAGTGGATRIALKALCGANNLKRYKDYTFTDISRGFLAPAQEMMAGFRDMNFSVLDIEEDPATQGFDPVYDIVMASQTLHATASIANTLANCRKLLRPGGKLVFESPFLSRESWDLALKDAGFSGTEVLLDDYPAPFTTTTTLLSTKAEEHPNENGLANGVNAMQQITSVELVYEGVSVPPLLEAVREALERLELSPRITTWDYVTEVQQGAHILAFLSGKRLLVDAKEAHLQAFQQLARKAAKLGRNPEGAIAPGLLRTIGTENPDFDTTHRELVQWLVGKGWASQESTSAENEQDTFEDREFLWQDRCIWLSRAVNEPTLQAYSEVIKTPKACGVVKRALGSEQPFRADFETPGILSSLYFKPYTELWQPLPPGWIDIRTVAVGLNWKDVGLASGRFDGSNLSSEYTGVVTAVGPGVNKFSVGDPVYGTGKGHFGNFARPGDDLVEVATMPLVYMTAVHAFDNLARLRAGQTVLIQLAQAKGADIFATVGTTEKVQFLVNKMGISASHIFPSSNPDDLARAAKLTAKGGFDVVLNSSSGDMLYASIQSLAPQGHLVDVGRMDVMGAKAIGLELFQKGASFSSFDLSLVLDNDPELGGELLEKVDKYYREGHIGPIHPFTATDVSKLDQTMLEFSKGTHIGKFVVVYTDPNSEVRMLSAPPAARFDVDACYIVTGGLGGLGRSTIRWMGGRGARHLVVLSRRGPDSPGAREFVEAMNAVGIDLHVVACDVSQRPQVDRVIRDATADRPLKGIVHSAVSYLDISFDKVSIDRNLHEATLTMPLDFFVMTTSIESICALATQSAYTAANNFQEYFARHRRRLGLPATAISFGFINDLGSLSTDSVAVDLFARNKVLTISEHQFLALLEPAFLNQSLPADQEGSGSHLDPLSAASIITCVDPAAMAAKKLDDEKAGISSTSVPRWYSDGRVSHMMRAFQDALRHSLDVGADYGDEAHAEFATAALRREFAQAVREGTEGLPGTIDLVKRAITWSVAEMLFIDPLGVNAGKTVAEHGVDSLIAAELRNWFLKGLGVNISMLELLDARTSIEQLSTNIATAAVSNSLPKAA